MDVDLEKRISDYRTFVSSSDLGTELSDIWKVYEKQFSDKEGHDRGYSHNYKANLNKQIDGYRKWVFNVIVLINRFFYLFDFIQRHLTFRTHQLGSWFFFGDRHFSGKIGLTRYHEKIYREFNQKSGQYDAFMEMCDQKGWSFSHNSFKSFSYFKEVYPYLKMDEPLNVIEVGSGMFNFGLILTAHLQKCTYVCVDLPNVILSSFASLKRNVGGSLDLYLPHEIDLFLKSDADKKVIYLLPSQIDALSIQYDLFVNHESFSEMNIHVVNDYLSAISPKVKTGGVCFLVNRYHRIQKVRDFQNISFADFTDFTDYNLKSFREIKRIIEPFRQFFPKQNQLPNVLYIGRRLEDG